MQAISRRQSEKQLLSSWGYGTWHPSWETPKRNVWRQTAALHSLQAKNQHLKAHFACANTQLSKSTNGI